MAVQVKFYSSLRKLAGCDGMEVTSPTVGGAVKEIEKQFLGKREFLKLFGCSMAILNGEIVTFLRGTATKLRDGDELVFYPPLGGG